MTLDHDVFYGDLDDLLDELLCNHGYKVHEPKEGDELCDGHCMHYILKDGKWR